MAESQCVLSTLAFLKPVVLSFNAPASLLGLGGPAPSVSHPGLLGGADGVSQVMLTWLDGGEVQTRL